MLQSRDVKDFIPQHLRTCVECKNPRTLSGSLRIERGWPMAFVCYRCEPKYLKRRGYTKV